MSTDDTRQFPIQSDHHPHGGGKRTFIPWWLAEIAYIQYSKNFGTKQSLETLAQRGGFGRHELLMLLRQLNIVTDDPQCLCPAGGRYADCPVHPIPYIAGKIPVLENNIAVAEAVQNYTLDRCPVCSGEVKIACRCFRNERTCANGHTWRRLDGGQAVMVDLDSHTDMQK